MSESKNILYIEDDAGLAALAQRRLGRAGLQVDTASNGEQGLEKIRAGCYAAILVDYKLPGMSGLDLIRSLAADDRLPPAVMVSGAGDLEVAVQAMRLGVADYLVKDVDSGYLDLLEPTIRRVLDTANLRRAKDEAEAALLDMAQRQAAILENIPDLAWLKDGEGRFIAVNAPFGEQCGVPPKDLEGKTDFDVWPADLAERYRDDDQAVMHSGTRKVVEEPLFDASGKTLLIETIKTPVFNATGEIVGTAGIGRDITERKRAEDRLFAEKERAQVTLHSIGDAVITTDADGHIEYLNPVAEKLTGWTLAEACGLPLTRVFRIISEETREPAPDPIVRCLAEGKVIGLANHTVLISRSGTEYAIQDSAAPIRSRQGEILGVVLVFTDVSAARGLAKQISHQAAHDELTGLVNRREFERRLKRAVENAVSQGNQHTLCYLDLDQFKVVNDTAGHVAGDEMLKQVTQILSSKVRSRDTLARIGGDEFSLILENCPLQKGIEVCESMIGALQDFNFIWEDRSFRVGVSIGIVTVTAATEDATKALSQADVACYTAKDLGRNRIHAYNNADGQLIRQHAEIHQAAFLREALEKGGFQLFRQPIFPVADPTGSPVEYEILLRMKDREGGLLSPGDFITTAERFGLMPDIDRWVIETAFHWYSKARHNHPATGIALNLSGVSLNSSTVLDFIRQRLQEFSIPGSSVCFEITESAAINHLGEAVNFVRALRKQGCRFALDDFGMGLSSFHHLNNIPIDYLKIDGRLVRDIAADSVDRAMVAAIHQVGNMMQIRTIAEWVETQAIAEVLREIGVDYIQGNFLASPKPIT